MAAFTATASAQQLLEDNLQRLRLHFEIPAPVATQRQLGDVHYTALSLPGYALGGEVGTPALPVQSHMIATPFCDNITVEVTNARYDTLPTLLPPFLAYPMQPARSKSDTSRPAPVVDKKVYSVDALHGLPLAQVQPLGVGRDRNLARLTYSPVSINPVTGQVVVCRSADITLRFVGADTERTLDHYRRYYTPAFTPASTLNSPFPKITNGIAPLRITIVAGNIPGIRQSASLQRFVDWKRKQGMLVDLIYTSDLSSNTPSDIAAAVKQLYLTATDETPAPTFLLLVGDHEQLPAFECNLSASNFLRGWGYNLDDHITDHYYTLWTSDNIRDCYLGRFSATDTATLNNIINKTLLYEKYQFTDDSYLARAALIAGVDNGYDTDEWDNAWRCADPSMDYIARYYINADNGYTDVTYYKNNIDFAPAGVTVTGSSQARNTASALRALYNEGIGWINYSAHGFEIGWGDPRFYNNDVERMTNNGKPSFMIGNCCLSSHFNTSSCFAETLLRKEGNAGAIGYIGGTNSTFWDQDFYFSVGVRDNIHNTMNTSYGASHLGSYDRLFHTHNEAFSNYAITAGAILHSGLMSVNSRSTSSQERDMIEYYWEIYELMGDPSLMPWLGTASDLAFSALREGDRVTVETEPYTYVALVADDLSLIAATYASSTGTAVLAIPASTDLSTAFFSLTAQNRKPLFRRYRDANVGIQNVAAAEVTLAPNPAYSRCMVRAEGLCRVELLDIMGRSVSDVRCSDECTLSLEAVPAGFYLVRAHTSAGVSTNKLVIRK